MIDIFDKRPIDLTNLVCHSGGAIGSDTVFETIGEEFGVKTNAYSYKTKLHTSPNKVEISNEDFREGVIEINKANKSLYRFGIQKYMNLLARNWAQVKYSDQVFAIGTIIQPGKKGGEKGYYNNGRYEVVSGGTGYAVQMAINNNKEVFVFDQDKDRWYRWSFDSLKFIELSEIPSITESNFAGIGTREIKSNGVKAIRDVYEKTFKIIN
jgi:hypothetical protein